MPAQKYSIENNPFWLMTYVIFITILLASKSVHTYNNS